MRLSFQLTSIALVVACGTLHAGAILSAQFAGSYTETTFATGLDYPVGMTQLSDGSFLVGETSPPAGVTSGQFAFYNGAGRVVRFTDTVQAGVADNAGTVIASGLPGAVTGVLTLGNGLIAVSTIVNNSSGIFNYNAADITFLRAGAQPTDAYTNVGSVHFDYPAGGGAASLKPTVAATGSGQFTIYFGLNALGNDGTPGPNVQVSGLINGQLPAGSLNSLTVQTGGGTPNVTGLTNLATGIRNASSPIVDAAGNVYFGDNGYEDAGGKPISTDELDFFAAGTSGSVSYGFPGQLHGGRHGSICRWPRHPAPCGFPASAGWFESRGHRGCSPCARELPQPVRLRRISRPIYERAERVTWMTPCSASIQTARMQSSWPADNQG